MKQAAMADKKFLAHDYRTTIHMSAITSTMAPNAHHAQRWPACPQ